MLPHISIEEAQAKLPDLIDKLGPGEEVVITKDDQPVAELVSQQKEARQPRQPGSAKGILVINVEDDEHLQDFEEYMP
ncbi:MAG: type II toxin-antitoxin system Phd/YefM family antitoxin [Candidatus Entotheonellia bacterium]